VVTVTVLSVLLLACGAYWWRHHGREFTDDAQVEAEIVPVPARVGGVVALVSFEENQSDKAGQVLAKIDDALMRTKVAQCEATLDAAIAAVDAAEAESAIAATNARGNRALANAGYRTATEGSSSAKNQIAEAVASLAGATVAREQAKRERERVQGLFVTGAVAQNAMDQANTGLQLALANENAAEARLQALTANASQAQSRIQEAGAKVQQAADVDVVVRQAEARAKVARAQVETARSALRMAQLDLSYTSIVAPVDGVASKKTLVVGQNLTPGQPIAQLVTPKRWVVANFKETQLEKMREGQHVELTVDAFPNHPIRGRLESFAGGTGSRFALLPPDNASGNFTKVVQRVPVRIALVEVPTGIALRPGMNIELAVDTRVLPVDKSTPQFAAFSHK
jgi:membrane fusion protein (multidrug efflux system)